jgi:hypothetical protein
MTELVLSDYSYLEMIFPPFIGIYCFSSVFIAKSFKEVNFLRVVQLFHHDYVHISDIQFQI